jgi:hypothetical protein
MDKTNDLKYLMTAQDIAKVYGISLPGQYQVTKHVFHDTALYLNAATLELFFFDQARLGDVANVLTNFSQNGQFPVTEAFLVTAIGVGFEFAVTQAAVAAAVTGVVNDINMLKWHASFMIKFSHKEYGPIPLSSIPQGVGPAGCISVANTIAAGGGTIGIYEASTNGVPQVANLYRMKYLIEGSVPFNIRLAWNAAQTITGNTFIRVYLHGWWFRQVG